MRHRHPPSLTAVCPRVVSGLGLLVLALVGGATPRCRAQLPEETVVDGAGFLGVTYAATDRLRNVGRAVAAAGDVNADGKPDLIVGGDGLPGVPGRAFVLLGGRSGPLKRDLPGPIEAVVPLQGGPRSSPRFGHFVAGLGDVDGDGIDDVLVGVPGIPDALFPAGAVLLVFGDTHLAGVFEFPEISQHAVVIARNGANGMLGLAGAGVGDVNVDGFNDFALGVPDGLIGPAGGPAVAAGKVHLVLGGPHLRNRSPVLLLDGPEALPGLQILGFEAASELGFAVAGAGDFDQDGLADVAVGSPGLGENGGVFVVFGKLGLAGNIDLSLADADKQVELRSSLVRARLGEAIAGGLDATGDGKSDLLLGAPAGSREGGGSAGAALLVPGAARFRGVAVAPVPGPSTALYRGMLDSGAGAAVSLVPDLSGDGLAELLIGAPNALGGRGAAHLVYGGFAEPGSSVFLEQLRVAQAAMFRANAGQSRLGRAVAGLADRNGDRRGDFALGAPGFPARGVAGAGAVFEVGVLPDPESPAPRNLKATLVAGGRVKLTWTIARVYRSLRVYRDGQPIDGVLPGHWQQFVDVSPGRGQHVYVIEADQDPVLRSNLAEIDVKVLPVRELVCKQIAGSLRVRVSWINSDEYEALAVVVDGRRVADLSPQATSFEFDTTPGDHVIEVFDPLGAPTGERPRCSVRVIDAVLPPIEGFTCVLEGEQSVRLSWRPNLAYEVYFIERNGIPTAKVAAGSATYLDVGVPAGQQRYRLLGLDEQLHASSAAVCEAVVPPLGGVVLRGHVEWVGGGIVKAGSVRIGDGTTGESLSAPVQVSSRGRFEALVPQRAKYKLSYELILEGASLGCGIMLKTQKIQVTTTTTSLTQEALVQVPPPLFLISALGAESPGQELAARWRALRSELDGKTFHFALVLPTGVARGAHFLANGVEEIKSHMGRELGSAARFVDMVAYGSAGLSARAFLAGVPGAPIRRLLLVGTPNLGTVRGHLEARAELTGRSPETVGSGTCAGGGGQFVFSSAAEQTREFLQEFNERVALVRGAEIHLIAGTAGLGVLDSVLECDAHDNRVCESSALGGIPGAILHRVAEDHEALGRGPLSIRLLAAILTGQPGAGGGEPPLAGAGGGADEVKYPSGNIYSGVLEPGGLGDFPMISDTSESIIIILNTEEPGGVQFQVRTPSGKTIDPPAAGALPDVEYQTYADGEGHIVQAYRFLPSELGSYVAELRNSAANEAIQYSLEAYVESGLELEARAQPAEIGLTETALVEALLTRQGQPELGATVEARVWRPNGDLQIVVLLDDGVGGDASAADGIYSALVAAANQPGIHQVEIAATESIGQVLIYQRAVSTRFQVRSDLISFVGGFASGTTDDDSNGVLDSLFVDTEIQTRGSGVFLLTGKLTDLAGQLVVEGGTLFSLAGAQTSPVRIYFAGNDLHVARKDGPYLLAEVRLFDGTAGFVEADRKVNAHQTASFSWEAFGLASSVPFIRADANGDGRIDISDAIAVLDHLFSGTVDLGCLDAADSNADAQLGLSDAIFILDYLFAGRVAIPAPSPDCAVDDRLGCVSHSACN